jgi:hypothetical protein
MKLAIQITQVNDQAEKHYERNERQADFERELEEALAWELFRYVVEKATNPESRRV